MNPLLLPEIVSVIFDYTKTECLYTCRLVSKLWNQESVSKLLRRLEIAFNCLADVEDYNATYQTSIDSDLPIDSLLPLKAYKFDGNWSSNPWQIPIQAFFNNANYLITTLNLLAPGWSLWDYTTFFHEMEFPCLLNLTFDCPSYNRELLSIAYLENPPQVQLRTLQSIEIHNLTHRFIGFLGKLIEMNRGLRAITLKESRILRSLPSTILENLLEQNILKKLQHLHLDYYLTSAHLMLMSKQFPLQLESLSFALMANTEPKLMYNFLKSTSATLKKLHLEYEYIWEKMDLSQFKFPPLENLKHLSIKFVRGSLNSLLVNIKSPYLKTLTLCAFESEQKYEGEEFTQYSTSLEHLSIVSSPNCKFYINEFCELFPSLKCLKLQGQLTNETMHSIITNMKSLEEMYLAPQRQYFSDEGLIGYNVYENSSRRAEDDYNLGICVGSPCICQLKGLKSLHVEMNPKLSDTVVSKGIAHCKNLKSLVLKSPKLTESSVSELVDKMELEYLTFHGGRVRPEIIAYAVDRIPHCEIDDIRTFDVRLILHGRDNVISCRVI